MKKSYLQRGREYLLRQYFLNEGLRNIKFQWHNATEGMEGIDLVDITIFNIPEKYYLKNEIIILKNGKISRRESADFNDEHKEFEIECFVWAKDRMEENLLTLLNSMSLGDFMHGFEISGVKLFFAKHFLIKKAKEEYKKEGFQTFEVKNYIY